MDHLSDDPWSKLKAGTPCPFARSANVLAIRPKVITYLDCDELEQAYDGIRHYLIDGFKEHPSGFFTQLRNPAGDAPNFELGQRIFVWFVAGLIELDGRSFRDEVREIESLDWQFALAGRRCFLNVFGPFYRRQHSKYIDSDSVLIFGQPEPSFDVCGVNGTRLDIRSRVRKTFDDAGMPYPGALIDTRIESHLYFFPEDVDGGPVKWWTA